MRVVSITSRLYYPWYPLDKRLGEGTFLRLRDLITDLHVSADLSDRLALLNHIDQLFKAQW